MEKRGYFHQYAGGGGSFSNSPIPEKKTDVVKIWTFELMVPHPLPTAIVDPSSVEEVSKGSPLEQRASPAEETAPIQSEGGK